ncbi:uncharacterized protein JN550_009966 [Neoarthrinium moseri]|uniref:uncharacterized protein n=1 Tax=Neoarthrinium moseri TaxID=1658444 RepID=UPI001FDE6774|nr:uncharacterized protein JN550_009966 [Neoarthrinium moseri]KAI1862819.1 hypothetical protein JN550_009966 [Neoarthrinium moseri]
MPRGAGTRSPQGSEPNYQCLFCNKSFGKESTRKRHYYYCRSKLSKPVVPRRKSCLACIRAKTRCSLAENAGQKACLRCTERGIGCEGNSAAQQHVVTRSTDGGGRSVQALGALDPVVWADTTSTILDGSDVSLDIAQISSLAPVSDEIATNTAQIELPDWTFDPALLEPFEVNHQLPDPTATSNALDYTSRLFSFSTNPSISRALQAPSTSFSLRTANNLTQRSLGSLMLRILRRYPFMLLRKETFPPFVNPLLYSGLETAEGLPEQALINAVSLVQMFKSRTESNKRFIWRLIRIEQERILSEHQSWDRWELLAAFQALLVYCLLRLLDPGVEDPDLDMALLRSVVASALSWSVGGPDVIELPDDSTLAWKDWSFNESRRRTVLIFRIINIVVDISLAVSCRPMDGFVLLPLPGNETLWDAQEVELWRSEFKMYFEERTIYGVSESGCLIRLRQDAGGIQSSTATWEEWSATVGDLGNLVMVAGSLIEAFNVAP